MHSTEVTTTHPFDTPEFAEPAVDFPESQVLLDAAAYYSNVSHDELVAYTSGCDHKVAAYLATADRDPLDPENGWMAEDEF